MTSEENPRVEIDFIYSDTCPDCPPAREALERVIDDFNDDVNVNYLRAKDVPEKVDEHDITHIPTVIIDGEVAHVETVDEKELEEKIQKRKGKD
ncbi:MAG: thioredoxin family protein [Candidatus Thermoplasmatota archaeon]